jgi:magnesium-transporting ATPase (P-type)
MYQPYPSSGKPVEPLRPEPPVSVLNAVKLMYAGAAVSTVSLIISLADIHSTKAAIRKARPNLTATQVNQLNTFIVTLAIVSGLLGIALWLWMSWANKQGKNWARILSTVLFGLATLDLFGVFSQPKTLIGLVFPVLTWLIGLAAVWLLWRPDSTAFFKAPRFATGGPPAGPSTPTQLM